MSRECRRVSPDWEHPKNENGRFVPLFDGAAYEEKARWDRGEILDFDDNGERVWKPKPDELEGASFPEPDGPEPKPENHMPRWNAQEATHYQMYETTSPGTPISPVMASKEKLAHWLADNHASAGMGQTASYGAWLQLCEGRASILGVQEGGEFKNGVEFAVQNGPHSRSR